MIHNDHLATPQKMTDASGVVVWAADNKPFGDAVVNPSSTITNNLKFPGQYYDAETGMHQNWRRDYNFSNGRYIDADPIGNIGGQNHLYAYVKNNPLRYSDSTGLAYFAKRTLGGRADFWLGFFSDNLHNELNDINWEIAHEQLFFEDGKAPTNLGYFENSSVMSDTWFIGYRMAAGTTHFNDCVMRKAVRNVVPRPYDFLSYNCQDWANDIRREYNRLVSDCRIRQECGVH